MVPSLGATGAAGDSKCQTLVVCGRDVSPLFLLFLPVTLGASVLHPIETQLRHDFPSLSLDSFVLDNGVAPNTAYLYKVRAHSASTTTAYTAPDLATTVIFTDPSLGGVFIKALHFTELRTAINAVHVLAGLGSVTWSDSIAPGVAIKAAHLDELRSNLDDARSHLSLPPLVYTDPTITAGSTQVRAQHVLDLRNGVQ